SGHHLPPPSFPTRRSSDLPWGQLAWLALAAALAPCTASRTLPCAGATGSLAAAAATSSLVHGPILHPACCTARGAAVTFCKRTVDIVRGHPQNAPPHLPRWRNW